jgi:hypothetical protein
MAIGAKIPVHDFALFERARLTGKDENKGNKLSDQNKSVHGINLFG